MSADRLRELVEAGDSEACVALLEGVTPKERSKLHPVALELQQEMDHGEWVDD